MINHTVTTDLSYFKFILRLRFVEQKPHCFKVYNPGRPAIMFNNIYIVKKRVQWTNILLTSIDLINIK